MAPEVLKRYRLWADALRVSEAGEAEDRWSASPIATTYVNAITGFEHGISYGLRNANRRMTKDQVLEQLALVFRYVGPRGMATIARAARAHEWQEPSRLPTWPKGWAPDPDAFQSGADFTTSEANGDDVRSMLAWYERWMGEVPKGVSFLARYRPALLKAYRARYENTLRLLPKQTEPWALLQISMYRGSASGVREGVLLGRGFGITRAQILEAISWGTFYGGIDSLALVNDVAGGVIDSWPD
jgi:hypothetical protein